MKEGSTEELKFSLEFLRKAVPLFVITVESTTQSYYNNGPYWMLANELSSGLKVSPLYRDLHFGHP